MPTIKINLKERELRPSFTMTTMMAPIKRKYRVL